MQSDRQFYPLKEKSPLENQVGSSYMHMPVASAFGGVLPPGSKHLKPFHDVEFQPSEVCPRNFIIFDQTDHRSQIMYHPEMAHKFSNPGLNMHTTYVHDTFGGGKEMDNDVTEISSPLEEDSDDINALLSSEDEEEEEEQAEYDEEEVSTARTYGNYGCSSPESCSNYGSKARKNSSSSSIQRSSGSVSSCKSERKQQRVKKMVRALRGIVPGGNQMNSAAVLDEAVQYLKSLKVEVQKLGVGSLKN